MNVFEIGAKIGLDASSFTKGLSTASNSVKDFAGKTKDILGGAAKAATAALGAASAGVAAFTKQAVDAYADYEQLVGGVETLFGDAAQKVKDDAQRAFKEAGMDVNAYMETSIQSAAALINSLDGDQQKAAELMNMSIIDMSDNVNKMGTSMEGVQNAYRGFSRGNFTMLDNLALGFAGTKEGMQELLDKAKELSGVEYDIESYSDIVQAIHTVQESMGITNTTAEEAASTISGSMASMKSAWRNLVIEMGKDNGDIGAAFSDLSESVATVSTNLLPRIEQSIGGIGTLISTAAPEITKAITTLLPKILPTLMRSAASLVASTGQAAIAALPEFLDIGKDLLKSLADTDFQGSGLLGKILDEITESAPDYFKYSQQILTNLANSLLNADYKKLGSSFSTVFTNAVNSMTDWIKSIDTYKVGEDIADFLNAIDWQSVANSLLNLLAEGIKGLSNAAVSFFANADLGNLLIMIGTLSGPKLLGGLNDYLHSSEGESLGKIGGMSWSSAFMAGIKAFGLGYAIGTWLADNITIGDKTLRQWVDTAYSKIESEGEKQSKEEQIKQDYGMFTTTDGRQGIKYDVNSTTGLSDFYLDMAEQGKVVYNSMAEKVQAMQGLKNRGKDISDFYFSPFMPEYQFDTDDVAAIEKQFKRDIEGDLRKKTQTQSVSYGTPEEVLYRNLPKYGDGGRVTKPTVALVGENEPENIIPDSKMNTGNVYIDRIELNIDGTFDFTNPEERRKIIEEFSAELRMLSIKEQRAMGGAGWA